MRSTFLKQPLLMVLNVLLLIKETLLITGFVMGKRILAFMYKIIFDIKPFLLYMVIHGIIS
jgi:hypothetical protein